MNVLFAASECAPFVKTGGLGDVVGALPKALKAEGVHVSVILPKYEDIAAEFRNRLTRIRHMTVPVGWRKQYCGIESFEEDGIRYYFLDNEYYFKRHGCYGYFDDGERFAFFSRAVLEVLPFLAERPDIIHCHDWQTGLIGVLLKSHYGDRSFYQKIRTVFTIHNLKYQGIFPKSVLSDLLDLDDRYFNSDSLEFYGKVSYMKAGLAYADVLTTVSRTYAEEIQLPFYGEHLDGFLRRRSHDLRGIVNGIDRKLYDPGTDRQLYFQYHTAGGKRKNKRCLQERLGLRSNEEVPMIAMITRLAEQKGIDLVLRVFYELIGLNIQFVLLGTGEQHYESAFRELAARFPEQVSANIYFDDGLARKIYAASDLFLMPSKFEPCGISQLLALRYGSLPVVRETGGLKDTVIPYNEFNGEGYGFSFTNYNAHDMLFTVQRALHFYREQPDKWVQLADRALRLNFGWETSAAAYRDLYHSLI
ncbi:MULTISPECIES: glycogen synthase GlgA [unclassified Sporolactobacillus]|uniref:glycogen synthase GlgA n=1 Tax=unclassified Sporolactobacillus TaxID=2628533 RepID=UPI002367D5C2|nr:glycogen synthase GlgA [Sporolactobacillus sp. CQH2019]MDD9148679.1 glycogen synthase GlgA [Sporolactobacillus sp. CQH2019]